jgi:hypothetical protein
LLKSSVRTGLASFSAAWHFSRMATSLMDSLSPERAVLVTRCRAFSTAARSARHSSVWITSMSEIGSTLPATWITLSSSKQRTTLMVASVSRMWARNLLPRPSPVLAPATRPAMSTNSTTAGTMRSGLTIAGQLRHARIRHLDDAHIGLDRAKGVVLRRNAGLGQGVEQGGFTDVGQAYDATLQTHENSLENNPLCTIAPNVDSVDVPDPRMARLDSNSYEAGMDATVFRGICPRFA